MLFAFFTSILNTFFLYLAAPILYHFGHYAFVTDVLVTAADLVDTYALYILSFSFIFFGALNKNFFFQLFSKSIFKQHVDFLNQIPLLNSLFTSFSTLSQKISKIFNFFLPNSKK
jgi:hypothetical protein